MSNEITINQEEIKIIINDAFNLIYENECNKFNALELLINHSKKFNLPKFISFGLYSTLSDLVSSQTDLEDYSKNNKDIKVMDSNTIINELINNYYNLINLSSFKQKNNENDFSLKFIEKKCLEKFISLIDSATGITSLSKTDDFKDDFRSFLVNKLNIPEFIVLGILTECFYLIFRNANSRLKMSAFDSTIKNISPFAISLRDYTNVTISSILDIYVLYI